MSDDQMTLAEHFEAWQREHGREVPQKDTPEYTAAYEAWVEWAFEDLHTLEG